MPGGSLPTPMRRHPDAGAAEAPTEQAHGACTCSQCTCNPCTCGQAAARAAKTSGSSGAGDGNKSIYRTTGGAGVLGSYAPPPAGGMSPMNTGDNNNGGGGGGGGAPGDAYQQMAQQVGSAGGGDSSAAGGSSRGGAGHGGSSSGGEEGARYEPDYEGPGVGDGSAAFPTATEMVGALHTALQAPPGAEGLQSRAPGGAGVTGSYGPPDSALPPRVPAGAAGGLAEEVDAAAEGIQISKL
ncbi:hypothetical protein CHLRE_06g278240v5 [Chlamydomonas reinhardtii]|uniref:Uncharacterized protein n=1 Tax=Chlamydomonas reinhardtii TaxID=3055 RepID=A0A2K3DP84_CHLRE|nr:uncharacterized protein CHLRE_06g278240v5 [Chlamydomonas reinhardtii]PNW82353.1 hypothetical protein CHLRE_06g278240v5 [Chlamydomonas reinhardtii]